MTVSRLLKILQPDIRGQNPWGFRRELNLRLLRKHWLQKRAGERIFSRRMLNPIALKAAKISKFSS